MKKANLQNLGYIISVIGVAIILLWIGIFKFTPTEAKAIEPLLKNSFLMSWMYAVGSLQAVSNIIGAVEIVTGVLLLLHFIWPKAGVIGGVLSLATFLVTLSFLFTAPNSFKTVDGILTTQFFILKDLMAAGISLLVVARSLKK